MATARLVLFARAREAAGTGSADLPADCSLDAFLAHAAERFGPAFVEVLAVSRVWLNGDDPAAGGATPVAPGDEVAVLPPVSGG